MFRSEWFLSKGCSSNVFVCDMFLRDMGEEKTIKTRDRELLIEIGTCTPEQ